MHRMQTNSKNPELLEIEYWFPTPKRCHVRPLGVKDILGELIQFKENWILIDEPDDELYPSVEEGIHALISNHEKKCKKICSKKIINLRNLRKNNA